MIMNREQLNKELKQAQEELKQNKLELTHPHDLDLVTQTWLELEQKQLKENIKFYKSQLKDLAS